MVLADDLAAGRAAAPSTCRSPTRCSSWRSRRTGPTACRSTASRARCTPPPAPPLAPDPTDADAEPAAAATRPRTTRASRSPTRTICLRFTARVFEDVKIGPSPEWLKQRLTAAGQRPISNVVDITNYVMLAHRASRCTRSTSTRCAAAGSSCAGARGGGDDVDPRRRRARRFDADMALVCDAEGPSGIAGVMGGQISEVSRQDHARADGGRHLGRARTSCGPRRRSGLRSGGVDAVREAAAPRAAPRGAAAGGAADGRAVRRADGAGHDRRLPGARRSRGWWRCGSRASSGCSASRSRRGRVAADPRRRWASRSSRRGRGSTVTVPVLARRRRPARGRPDRGGRAHLRARQAADHAARARAGGGPADARPAPAPPAGGRAARPRPARDRGLELHRAARRSSALRLAERPAAEPGQPAQRGRRA